LGNLDAKLGQRNFLDLPDAFVGLPIFETRALLTSAGLPLG